MLKSMRRARRSARAITHGREILELVQNTRSRKDLVKAAESGSPPVTAISAKLVDLVGLKEAKLAPIKQFTGLCIRAVLEEEGFQVAETGVRLSNDAVFRTGAVYKRLHVENEEAPDLLHRIITGLTDEEAKQALMLLEQRTGYVSDKQ